MKSVLSGQSNTAVGLVVMIPNLAALIAMILVLSHSDRTMERRYHLATSSALAGAALVLVPFLRVMGFSGLFEEWRVARASALLWFYEGTGGSFDYWPEGLEGPMRSEQPPFGNVALCVDTDRIYHRIGPVGDPDALPRMSASAQIQPDGDGRWAILENGEVRASYPSHAIRFSVLWKAQVRKGGSRLGNLTLDQIVEIFVTDLRNRCIDFHVPSDPLTDTAWILLLQRIYASQTATPRG